MPRPGSGSQPERMHSGNDGSRMHSGHHMGSQGSGRRAGMGMNSQGSINSGNSRNPENPGNPGNGGGFFGFPNIFGSPYPSQSRSQQDYPQYGYPSQSRYRSRRRRSGASLPIDIFGFPQFPSSSSNSSTLPGDYYMNNSNEQYNPQGGPSIIFDENGNANGTRGSANGAFPPNSNNGTPLGGPNKSPRNTNTTKSAGLAPLFGIIAAIILFGIIFMMPSCSNTQPNRNDYNAAVPASTYNREKITPSQPFNKNCVQDQIGWFSNTASAGNGLRNFYDKTGVQPYVLFAKYNPKLTTDKEKQAWADQWFETHVHNEDAVLFTYFADQDTENSVGYMDLTIGKRAGTVMDQQAQEIFWTYLDQYWYSDRSTDDAVVQAFNSSADRIMTKTTTQQDVTKWIIVAVIVVLIVASIIVALIIMFKRKREHEEYVERMVTTPLETSADPILQKYDHDETKGQ